MIDTTSIWLAHTFIAALLLLFALICRWVSESPLIRAMLTEIIRRHKLECAGCTALVLVAVGMMLAI